MIEEAASSRQPNRITIVALNLAIFTASLAWAMLPFSRIPVYASVSFALLTSVLFFRSFALFRNRSRDGPFTGGFRDYVAQKRVVPQNISLGLLAGFSGLIVNGVILLANAVGALWLILAFDLLLIAIITYTFFNRPGVRKTLSRSIPADQEKIRHMQEVAKNCGVDAPELRIIPSSGKRVPNAFSWGLPGGKSFIFASDNLYLVLTMEEVGGIFTHELGHLRGRHSEKSFLLMTLVPLGWFNSLMLPFVFLPLFAAIPAVISSIAVAALYILFKRGTVSRRFEKIADVFAARNYDRDIYLSSLRKLTQISGFEKAPNRSGFVTHDTFEERERLIRGV